MEYTIKKLGDLSGVSARTLRYYDEIDLLKPLKVNDSGYRMYGDREVDLLQQIMFYKSMDMKLESIKEIIMNPSYDISSSLIEHHKKLLEKKVHLEQLILAVEKTIAYKDGGVSMSNEEKFEVFKKEKIATNEKMYGTEIRKKYENDAIEESYSKVLKLNESEELKMNQIETELIENLVEISENQNINEEKEKAIFEKHKQWISFTMKYNKEVHKSLAEMYIVDERFSKYYDDKAGKKVTTILSSIIIKYINI